MKLKESWFNVKLLENAENSKEAEIFIYDEIGGWGIHANELINQLKDLGDVETIHLRINSPGGSIIQGNTIYNAIKRHAARVVTHIDGLAASMGSVIALAGDEIHMADNALFMIHNPWSVAMGDAEELRKQADLLDTMKETILNAYGKSNLPREELVDLMDAETWFTAKEAKQAGFVDVIENELEQAASLDESIALAGTRELNVPVEKAVAALNLKHSQEVEFLKAELSSAHDQLAKDAVLVAEAENLKDQIQDLEAQKGDLKDEVLNLISTHQTELEELNAQHQTELEEAKEITESAIAERAASIVGAQTTDPVTTEGDDKVMTEADFWSQYKKIRDLKEKNAFYQEHKHILEK